MELVRGWWYTVPVHYFRSVMLTRVMDMQALDETE